MFEERDNFLFGLRPLEEAIASGKQIEKLLIQKNLQQDSFELVRKLAKHNQIPYTILPKDKLDRITRKNHQGIIAFITPVSFSDLDQVLGSVYDKGKIPLLLVLDRITDVRNFGAIARSAECAGADAIIVPTRGSAQINADAVKTSAGALFKIPVCRVSFLLTTLNVLKKNGVQIVCCTEKARDPFYTADFKHPTAIVMGSEEDGVSQELLDVADKKVKIPMMGSIESLNVSVASGVILFEALRQRI